VDTFATCGFNVRMRKYAQCGPRLSATVHVNVVVSKLMLEVVLLLLLLLLVVLILVVQVVVLPLPYG